MFDRQEWINFLIKVGIPATIGISIKLAVQSKRERMTLFRIVLSFVTGVGCAYLAYPMLLHNASENYLPMLIAVVSISGEKISEYVIYKWNLDYFLTSIIDAIRQMIIKIISNK